MSKNGEVKKNPGAKEVKIPGVNVIGALASSYTTTDPAFGYTPFTDFLKKFFFL